MAESMSAPNRKGLDIVLPPPEDANKNIMQQAKKEFEALSKKGLKVTQEDYVDLTRKYVNSPKVIDAIMDFYAKRQHKVSKIAEKYANKYRDYYYNNNKPLHILLEKAMKIRRKFDNDWEFDEFRRILVDKIYGNNPSQFNNNMGYMMQRTRIGHALGVPVQQEPAMNIRPEDERYLAEIIARYEETIPLHRTVVIQSLFMKSDMELLVTSGQFLRERNNSWNHIHPIIAAFFMVKIPVIEHFFVYANMARIIKSRHEQKQLSYEPDLYLYNEMIIDPNDVVCDIDSALKDLNHRSEVQVRLWNTIESLRRGKFYYDHPQMDLIPSLAKCRNNFFDNADMVNGNDEGSIVRHLFNVFSFRPTIITMLPTVTIANIAASGATFNTSFNGGIMPYGAQPIPTVTAIPLIKVTIPPKFLETSEAVDLAEGINQTVWINEKGNYVPKQISIIYNKGVLVFYVNRRAQNMQMRSFATPLTFSQLPMLTTGFEKCNSYPVTVQPFITLPQTDDTYNLHSVVTVIETKVAKTSMQGAEENINIIIGSRTLFAVNDNETGFSKKYYVYDPIGAGIPFKTTGRLAGAPSQEHDVEVTYVNRPVSEISPYSFGVEDGGSPQAGFFDLAQKYGTVFTYVSKLSKKQIF